MHWLLHVTGLDNGSGIAYLFWSGFFADITIITGWWRHARKTAREHRERLAQAAQHHREQVALAREHHGEIKAQAEKHHRQRLDQADAHHEALKAHTTKGMTDG